MEALLKTKLIGRRQLQNLVFSTDGKLLFTGDAYGQSVFSYRTTDLELSREYKGPSNDSLLDIALSSDGTILSALYMGNTYLDSEGKTPRLSDWIVSGNCLWILQMEQLSRA